MAKQTVKITCLDVLPLPSEGKGCVPLFCNGDPNKLFYLVHISTKTIIS